MKVNMGTLDRIVRAIITAIVVTLYFTHVIDGTLGIVLMVIAGVFLLTSLVSFCPVYAVFGLNSCSIKKKV